MKICAITMVYRDYWALAQWYAHYSKHLGAENLYVIAHGHDVTITAICPGASILFIPRDDLSSFDKKRNVLLNSIQDGLAVSYDWVIRTDADELICLDPNIYSSFCELFTKFNDKCSLFAVGINIVEAAEDLEFELDQSVFINRRNAIFSGHYSKAFAVKRGMHLARHGVISVDPLAFFLPKGVYLVHLKYANTSALQIANIDRSLIAKGDQSGLPGDAWKNSDQNSLRILSSIERLPEFGWEQSVEDAFSRLSVLPEVSADKGIVRARSIKFTTRTLLPKWFKDY
jgi:hypothetical protein